MTGRSLCCVGGILLIGATYNIWENQADAWPALLAYVGGGAVVGYFLPRYQLLLFFPLGGSVTALLWRLAEWDSYDVQLPVYAVLLIGLVVGAFGVPAALLGMYARRKVSRAAM